MRRGIATILFATLLPACGLDERAAETRVAAETGPIAPLPEDHVVDPGAPGDSLRVEAVWDYIESIDRWLEERPDDERLFARLTDGRWVPVADPAAWPEGTVVGAGVLIDATGIVRQVFIAPVEGPDSVFVVYTHVFDDDGRTVFFERAASFPGGECTHGKAHETASYVFDEEARLISKTYDLVDEGDQPLDPASCAVARRDDYRIERSVRALLRSTGLDAVVDAIGDRKVPVIS
jgi:hypothetical protein